jgi:hypothetical protein
VELADGSLFHLISISSKPGFGFITLRPHPEDQPPTEVVVPLGSIAQIRLGPAEPPKRLGFALPVGEAPSTA